MPSSKNVIWSYYKQLNFIDDSIQLSGFRGNGSIVTNQAIKYDKYLNLKFKVFVHKDSQKDAAILDIDFWNKKNNKSFLSVIVANDSIDVIITEESKIVFARQLKKTSDWKTFDINLDHNQINILVNQDLIEYVFKNPHKFCTISFGNNVVPIFYGTTPKTSLSIKEVLVETENGSFPLIIDNLNNTALY
jgi:hypothetical protein